MTKYNSRTKYLIKEGDEAAQRTVLKLIAAESEISGKMIELKPDELRAYIEPNRIIKIQVNSNLACLEPIGKI